MLLGVEFYACGAEDPGLGGGLGARALPGGGLAIDVTFPGPPNSASAPR